MPTAIQKVRGSEGGNHEAYKNVQGDGVSSRNVRILMKCSNPDYLQSILLEYRYLLATFLHHITLIMKKLNFRFQISRVSIVNFEYSEMSNGFKYLGSEMMT